jgi:hypothetical protein
MPVRITCPYCGRDLRLPEELYEGPAECPCCQGAFAVRWHRRGDRPAPESLRGSGRRACGHCGQRLSSLLTRCPFCGARVQEE